MVLRLNRCESETSRNEKKNVTTEYIEKQRPPHSTPEEYNTDFSSNAPKTLRATATGKYSHMQNRPSQVKICTHASCFIVEGISARAEMTSRVPPATPVFSAFIFLKTSMFSGGFSFVVKTVQSTATRMATAPTQKEDLMVTGMACPALVELS